MASLVDVTGNLLIVPLVCDVQRAIIIELPICLRKSAHSPCEVYPEAHCVRRRQTHTKTQSPQPKSNKTPGSELQSKILRAAPGSWHSLQKYTGPSGETRAQRKKKFSRLWTFAVMAHGVVCSCSKHQPICYIFMSRHTPTWGRSSYDQRRSN